MDKRYVAVTMWGRKGRNDRRVRGVRMMGSKGSKDAGE